MTATTELFLVAVRHTRASNFEPQARTRVYENVTSFFYSRRITFELPRDVAEQELGCEGCKLRIQSGRKEHFLNISLRNTKASKKLPAQLVAHCQIQLIGNKKPEVANCAVRFARTVHLTKELPSANQENNEEET